MASMPLHGSRRSFDRHLLRDAPNPFSNAARSDWLHARESEYPDRDVNLLDLKSIHPSTTHCSPAILWALDQEIRRYRPSFR
jgi:hypothetical protein